MRRSGVRPRFTETVSLTFLTAGESHGPALSGIVEGLPAGVQIDRQRINYFLAERQRGYGRSSRMKLESDKIEIIGGVRAGFSLGSPIGFTIANRDFANWSQIMSPDLETMPPAEALPAKLRPKHTPRPGHADLAGALKYNQTDMRNVLERASARETAARVAACAFPRLLLEQLEIEFTSHVVQIGSIRLDADVSFQDIATQAAASDMRCVDDQVAARMRAEVDRAREEGDTLGGEVEFRVRHVPAGLGRFSQARERLSARLAAALMSIPACKGVEIGDGFALAARRGSAAHDEIYYDDMAGSGDRRFGFRRYTNRAGGLEGGITNGEELVLRLASKPLSTLRQPLGSVDVVTKEAQSALVERSDVCAIPAYGIIGEMLLAWTLAEAMLEKFGADTTVEIERNLKTYLEQPLGKTS
jgi:chorismate synthase